MASSPHGSFYDLSDIEEDEYNTITHTPSGRGVKLLFSKSKVYIHPTPSAKDNIPGYIALLQQRAPTNSRPTTASSTGSNSTVSASLLLAWLPESSLGNARDTYVKVDLSEGEAPPKQSYLVPPPPTTSALSSTIGTYAFAIPVSNIYSLLIRPPSIGWWFGSVIINSRAGDSFPALFFHDNECQSTILHQKRRSRESFNPFGEHGQMYWGGDEVLRWLRRYVQIERSGAEPNIYLVEPSAVDKEGFGVGGRPAIDHIVEKATGQNINGAGGAGRSESSRDAQMDPVTKFVKEAGWNLMEKFSKVTTFTRRTAQEVIENPKIPPNLRRLLKNPEVQTLQDEFDSARIYLASWAMGIAEQSERDRNQKIWTAKDILEMEETDVGEFELLDSDMSEISMQERRRTVTLKEWVSYFDPKTGRLQITANEVKERIFHGGLDANDGVRKEAWLFLLGVYEWNSSLKERKIETARLRDEYVKLKGAWWDRLEDLGGDGPKGEWWREQRGRIEKDVHRTDRNVPIFAGEDTPHPDPNSPFADVGTNVHLEQMKEMLLSYNEFNKDLGYVQGMSDLLAPIYAVLQDDAIAFWAFTHYMDRMERNFLRDQSGMRLQLLTLDHLVQLMDPKLYLHLQKADSTNFFFFFRMLLVFYKREFEWTDVLRLWESLWTDYLSSGFSLFVALAILEKHRDVIMTHLQHFDEVLKYVNDLSQTMDLESTLVRAEALFKRFQRIVEAIDRKSNFPAPKPHQHHGANRSTSSLGSSFVDVSSGESSSGRKPEDSNGTEAARGGDKGKQKRSVTQALQEMKTSEKEKKVVSPELRALLRKEVVVLERKVVRREGEGMASVRK